MRWWWMLLLSVVPVLAGTMVAEDTVNPDSQTRAKPDTLVNLKSLDVVRLEVAARGSQKDFHHDRDKRRCGGHRSQRDLGAEDVRRRSKAAGDKDKERKKKKRSSSSSSSSASPSSSSSSSVAKKKQAKKQAKKAAERAQASEDRLMAEIQKLKKTLKQSSEPVTPAKLPATRACEQLTPKAESHLKNLLSFMSDGEVTPLVDVGKVHTWHDIEDQLNGKLCPSGSSFCLPGFQSLKFQVGKLLLSKKCCSWQGMPCLAEGAGCNGWPWRWEWLWVSCCAGACVLRTRHGNVAACGPQRHAVSGWA